MPFGPCAVMGDASPPPLATASAVCLRVLEANQRAMEENQRAMGEMQRALAAAVEKESEVSRERAELRTERQALESERARFEEERCVHIAFGSALEIKNGGPSNFLFMPPASVRCQRSLSQS